MITKDEVDSSIYTVVDRILSDAMYTLDNKVPYPFVSTDNYSFMRTMVRSIIEEWLEEKALEEKVRLEAGES